MNRNERKAQWRAKQETNLERRPADTDESSGIYTCSRMSAVEAKSVDWLWKPYLPIGKIALLDGWPGIGKSYITCKLAAIVSRGGGFPNGYQFEPGNVLMFNAEDGLADTLRPRLDACGADVDKVIALDILQKDGMATFDQVGLIRFEATIIEYKPTLVMIDPLFAFTGAGMDIHRANESRAVSSRLAAIAAKYNLAMLCVRHLNKGGGGGSSMRAGIGSIDWIAAARVGLLAGCDPDDEKKMALTNYKNNLAKKGEPLGYRIDFDPQADQGDFVWTGISDLTADRILAPHQHEDAGESAQRADAKDFLYQLLKDGRVESSEVDKAIRGAKISDHSIRQAKRALSIKTYKEGGEFGGRGARWYWEILEQDIPQDAEIFDYPAQGLSEFGNHRLVEKPDDKPNKSNGLAQGGEIKANHRLVEDKGQKQTQLFPQGGEMAENHRLVLDGSKETTYRDGSPQGGESQMYYGKSSTQGGDSTPCESEDVTPKDWKSPF